tara:strand:- start:748 stop:1062 length:315 start_codon:yes stop_codon:yes gene_type:complete
MSKSTIGSDYGEIEIDFDPAKYKTPAGAAKALYKVLSKINKEYGLKDTEIMLMNPERAEQYSGSKAWAVVWEAGPYEWALGAYFPNARGWSAEPYYSFDLHFYK